MATEPTHEELREFWEHADTLFCVVGSDLRFERINPAWTRVLGWSADELIGRKPMDLVHHEDRERTQALNPGDASDPGRVRHFENRYQHKDGSVRWLLWMGYFHEGRWFGTARDITATHVSQTALQVSERRSRAMLEALQEGLLIIGPDLRIIEANDRFCAMVGWTARELMGVRPPYPWASLVPGSGPVSDALRAARHGERATQELEFVRRNGEVFTVLIDAAPLPVREGQKPATLCVIRDITELADTRARLQEAHRIARLSSWEWHNDGRVIVHQDALRPRMNPRYEVTGDMVLSVIAPEDREKAHTLRDEVASGARDGFVVDLRVGVPDSDVEWVEWRARPLLNADGSIIGVRGTAQDITERKRAESHVG